MGDDKRGPSFQEVAEHQKSALYKSALLVTKKEHGSKDKAQEEDAGKPSEVHGAQELFHSTWEKRPPVKASSTHISWKPQHSE